MVLHNPNNWHWVNKDARDWAKDYFSAKLTKISAQENGISANVTKVVSVEGDVDVSQRKGKVITIFDVEIKLEYTGKNADGVEASGSITVPEVAHDTAEDEYVFEIANYADTKDKQGIRDLVRTKITPQLRQAFASFSGDLMAQHGKDIQHGPAGEPGPSTPKAAIPSPSPAQKPPTDTKAAAAPVHTKGTVINTVTLNETYEFNTSAEQLFLTFVDAQRVTAFTRAPPDVWEPKEGGKFVLFGGNIEGSFKSLEPNKKIVQDWRLADWPKGHFSILALTFDQGTDSTSLRLAWEGVPVGQDEATKRNFEDYYVRSIKTTFGYGPSFPSRVASYPSSPLRHETADAVAVGATWREKLEIAGPAISVPVLLVAAVYVVSVYWT